MRADSSKQEGECSSSTGLSDGPVPSGPADAASTIPFAVAELGASAKKFYRDLRIGDIIHNGWASDSNPLRFGVVVHKFHRPGRFNAGDIIRCVRYDGKQDEYFCESRSRLAVVGRVRITEVLDAMLSAQGIVAATEGGSASDDTREKPDPVGDAPNPNK